MNKDDVINDVITVVQGRGVEIRRGEGQSPYMGVSWPRTSVTGEERPLDKFTRYV